MSLSRFLVKNIIFNKQFCLTGTAIFRVLINRKIILKWYHYRCNVWLAWDFKQWSNLLHKSILAMVLHIEINVDFPWFFRFITEPIFNKKCHGRSITSLQWKICQFPQGISMKCFYWKLVQLMPLTFQPGTPKEKYVDPPPPCPDSW